MFYFIIHAYDVVTERFFDLTRGFKVFDSVSSAARSMLYHIDVLVADPNVRILYCEVLSK